MLSNNNRSKIVAFFDLDLTITNKDTFRYFIKTQLFKNKRYWHLLPIIFLYGIMRKLKIISHQTFKEKALFFLIGKSDVTILNEGRRFFEEHLINTIRKQAVEKIRWHKQMGHFVFLATSSPDIYLSPLTKFLNCDDYISSKLSYYNNRFTGKFKSTDCLGKEKKFMAEAICKKLQSNISNSYAYSDHQSDLPLLEAVGNPVTISPTRQLKKIAHARNWIIYDWKI